MHIVAAGMHDAGLRRFISQIILFLDGKSVHVSPQSNNAASGIFSFYQAHNTRGGHDLKRNTNALQFFLYKPAGFKFMITQFGMGMQVLPYVDMLLLVTAR